MALHLALTGIAFDSDVARKLKQLEAKNLLLGCTPVVNLFKRAAVPITMTHAAPEYALVASAEQAPAYDIYSVDTVQMLRNTRTGGELVDFRPYYSLRHGEEGGKHGYYWITRRDEVLALTSPGHEIKISLVDLALDPLANETATISATLSCTNRNLPHELAYGLPGGDLQQDDATDAYRISLLRKPGMPCRYPAAAHWRLIAQLSLNLQTVLRGGVDAFKEMLLLHDIRQSPITQRQIRGIAGWAHRPCRAWLDDRHGGALVHGIEIELTLDEEAYAGSGLHAFVQVLDHFIGMHAQLNSFTRLVVVAKSNGEELLRCKPRSGNHILA